MEVEKAQDLQGGWVSKLEIQWYSSSLDIGRLKTQEEPVFQFDFKDRKNQCPSSKAVRQKTFSLSV